MFDGICELVIETDDVSGLTRFYEELGMPLLSEEGDRAWLAAGKDSRLGIWSPGEKEHGDRGGRHVHFALSIDSESMAELMGRLERRGIGVKGPVEHEGGDRSAYFYDPAGNRVELWNFFREGEGARAGVSALED